MVKIGDLVKYDEPAVGIDHLLEDEIDEAQTPIVKAEDVSIADTGNVFTGDQVEEALDELVHLAGGNTITGEQILQATGPTSAETLLEVTPDATDFSGNLLELNGLGKGWTGKILVWDTQAANVGGSIDATGNIQLDAGASIYQDGDEYALQTWVDDNTAADADVTAAVVDHNDNLGTSPYPHAFRGLRKRLADGVNETANVDEVKLLTLTAGLVGQSFKLEFNAHKSNLITLPVGGFASLTATEVKAGLVTISDWVAKTADIAVVETPNNTFEITFSGTLGRTNVGDLTVPGADITGAELIAGPPVVVDDGTGASTVGVAGTQLTVAGAAVGDILSDVVVSATKAAISTQTVRAFTDFRIAEAGKVDIMDNVADNSNNEYLVEYIDLT